MLRHCETMIPRYCDIAFCDTATKRYRDAAISRCRNTVQRHSDTPIMRYSSTTCLTRALRRTACPTHDVSVAYACPTHALIVDHAWLIAISRYHSTAIQSYCNFVTSSHTHPETMRELQRYSDTAVQRSRDAATRRWRMRSHACPTRGLGVS